MVEIKLVLEFVFLLILCGSITSAFQQDYHTRYENWKNMYKSYPGASGYLQTAKQKSNHFPQYSRAERDAVEVVNLYTQDAPKIYRTVNNQYREGKVQKIWADFAALLNEAIDGLLKYGTCNKYRELYRGSSVLPQNIPGTSEFKGFTSASRSPNIAVKFGIRNNCTNEGCQVLLVLNGAQGLAVKQYSSFSMEDEIIIKLNSKFIFPSSAVYHKNIPSESTKLQKELQRLNITTPVKVLAGGSPTNKRRRRSAVYCVSDGHVFVPSYITLVSFLITITYMFDL